MFNWFQKNKSLSISCWQSCKSCVCPTYFFLSCLDDLWSVPKEESMPDVKSRLQTLSLLSFEWLKHSCQRFLSSLHCFLFILIQRIPECFQRSTFCVCLTRYYTVAHLTVFSWLTIDGFFGFFFFFCNATWFKTKKKCAVIAIWPQWFPPWLETLMHSAALIIRYRPVLFLKHRRFFFKYMTGLLGYLCWEMFFGSGKTSKGAIFEECWNIL